MPAPTGTAPIKLVYVSWTPNLQTTISNKIQEYGFHNDHDFRCQGLRDITSLCIGIKGLFPLEAQEMIAKHLIRSIRDNSGDVSLYALSVYEQYLPHLSENAIIDILIQEQITLILDSRWATPRTEINTDGSAPAHTHPLIVASFKATIAFLAKTRRQANNKALVEMIYNKLINEIARILNVEDNPDIIPNRSPSIHLKLAMLEIIPSLAEHLARPLATKVTSEQAELLLKGVMSSIHHHYGSISVSAAACLGPVISLFTSKDQTKAVVTFLERFGDENAVPKLVYPTTPEEAQAGYRIAPSTGERIKLYKSGSETLNLTQLYASALSTFPKSLPMSTIQPHFNQICSGLIFSLPTILLTTRPIAPAEDAQTVVVDREVVGGMNLTLGYFSAGEFAFIKSLLISIQTLTNITFNTTALPAHTKNTHIDFTQNQSIDGFVQETKEAPTLTPTLPADLVLFLQTAMVNCLFLDPFFSYPNSDDLAEDPNQVSGVMGDPDFDDDFADDNDGGMGSEAAAAQAPGYDPDFDDDFGDDNAGPTSMAATNYDEIIELDDYYDYIAPETTTAAGTKASKKQQIEQLLDQSSSIRAVALNAMVQFNTSTLMSIRQYVCAGAHGAENIVTIPDSTPLSVALINNPIWLAAINFALREHDPAQLTALLQALPIFLSTVSYVNLILRQNNNKNPLLEQISPLVSEIANTMINYIKSGTQVTIRNLPTVNFNNVTLLLPNQHPTNHLALWGLLGNGDAISPVNQLLTATQTDLTSSPAGQITIHNGLYPEPTALHATATGSHFPQFITTKELHTATLTALLANLTKRIALILNSIIITANDGDDATSPTSKASITGHSADLLASTFTTIMSITSFFNTHNDPLQPGVTYQGDNRFFATSANSTVPTNAPNQLKTTFDLFLISTMTQLLPHLLHVPENSAVQRSSIWILFAFLFKNTTATTLFNTTLSATLSTTLAQFTKANVPTTVTSTATPSTLFVTTVTHLVSQWYTKPTKAFIISSIAHIYEHLFLILATTTATSPAISRSQCESIFSTISQAILFAYTSPLRQPQQLYNLNLLQHLVSILPTNYFPSLPQLFSETAAGQNTNLTTTGTESNLNLGLFTNLIAYVIAQSVYSFEELAKAFNTTAANSKEISWAGSATASTTTTMGSTTTTDENTGLLSATLASSTSYRATINPVRKRKNKSIFCKMPSWLDGLPGIYSKNWWLYKDQLTAAQITAFEKAHPQPVPQKKKVVSTASKKESTTTTSTKSGSDTEMSNTGCDDDDNDDDDGEELGLDFASTTTKSLGDDPYIQSLGHNFNIIPTLNITQYVFDLLKLITTASTAVCPHIFKLALFFTGNDANGHISALLASLYLLTTQSATRSFWGRLYTMYLSALTYLTIPYYATPPAVPAQAGPNTLIEQCLTTFITIVNGMQQQFNPPDQPNPLPLDPILSPQTILQSISLSAALLNNDALVVTAFPSLCKLVQIPLAETISPYMESIANGKAPPTSPSKSAMTYTTLQLELCLAILYNIGSYPTTAFSINSADLIQDILSVLSGILFFGQNNANVSQTPTFARLVSICLQQYTHLGNVNAKRNPMAAVTNTNGTLQLQTPIEQINSIFRPHRSGDLSVQTYQKLALLLMKTDTHYHPEQSAQCTLSQTQAHGVLTKLLASATTIVNAFNNATDVSTLDFHPHLLPQFQQFITSPAEMGQDDVNINGSHLIYLTIAAFTTLQSTTFASYPLTPQSNQQFIDIANGLVKLINSDSSPILITLTTAFIHLCLFLPQPTTGKSFLEAIELNLHEAMVAVSTQALGDNSNIFSTPEHYKLGVYTNAIAMTLSRYAYLSTTLTPTAFLTNALTTKSIPFFTSFVDPIANPLSTLSPSPITNLVSKIVQVYAGRLVHTTTGNTTRRIDQIGTDLSNFDSLITPFILLLHPSKFGTFLTPYITVLTTGTAESITLSESWIMLASVARGIDKALEIVHGVFSTLLQSNTARLQTPSGIQTLYYNAVTQRFSPFISHLFSTVDNLARDQDVGMPGLLKLTVKNELIAIMDHTLQLELQTIDLVNNPIQTTNLPNIAEYFNITNTTPSTQTHLFTIDLDTFTIPLKTREVAKDNIITIDPAFLSYLIQLTTIFAPNANNTAITTSITAPAFSFCAGVNHVPTVDFRSSSTSTSPPNFITMTQLAIATFDTASYLTPIPIDAGSDNADFYSDVITQFNTQTTKQTATPTATTMLSFYATIYSTLSIRQERLVLATLLSELAVRKNYVVEYKQGVTTKYSDDCLVMRKNALNLFSRLVSPYIQRGYGYALLPPQLTGGKSPVLSAFLAALSDVDVLHSAELRQMWLAAVETIATVHHVPTIPYMPSTTNTFALSDETTQQTIAATKLAAAPPTAAPADTKMTDGEKKSDEEKKAAKPTKVDFHDFPNLNPLPITSSNPSSASTGGSDNVQIPTLFVPIVNDGSLVQITLFTAFAHLFSTRLRVYLVDCYKMTTRSVTEPCLSQVATLIQLTYYLANAPHGDYTFKHFSWSTKTAAEQTADKQTNDNVNFVRLLDQTVQLTAKLKDVLEYFIIPTCTKPQ